MRSFGLPKFMYITLSWPKVSSLILQLYCVTSIFYIFRNGYPQPADMLLFIGMSITFLFFLLQKSWVVNAPIALGLLFAMCTFVINLAHYTMLPDKRFVLSSLYYLYNMGIFIYCYALYKKNQAKLIEPLVMSFAIAIFFQAIFVFLLESKIGPRAIGTFNNPNQLSYWSLLVFCILVGLRYPAKFKWYDYGLIGMLCLIAMESLSKAALISFFIVFVGVSFTRLVDNFGRAVLVMLFLALVSFAVFSFESITGFVASADNIQNTVTRLSEIGQDSDDNLEGRGYNRVVENPQYLLLGAGEGGYGRFAINQLELHSGIATLLFCYGISGSVIFGFFLLAILRRLPAIYWVLMFALLFYGLTHQNIRFSLFWLFLGLITAQGELIMAQKQKLSPNRFVQE